MDPQSAINILKQMINTKFQKDEDLKLLMQLFDIISNQYNKTSKLPGYYYYFCFITFLDSYIENKILSIGQLTKYALNFCRNFSSLHIHRLSSI